MGEEEDVRNLVTLENRPLDKQELARLSGLEDE